MKFEEILKQIGGWGRYQKLLFLALSFVGFPNAFHGLVQTFIGSQPAFICADNGLTSEFNETLAERYQEVQKYQKEECFMGSNKTNCQSFLYDQTQFKSTIVTKWNLVCDKKYLTEIDTSLFMAGKLIGAFLLGIASDIFGRRKIFFLSVLLLVLSGLIAYIAPLYTIYLVARLLAGIANSGTTLAGYILALELVDPENRPIPGILWHIVNATGNFVLLFFAYFIREWDKLMLAITLPCLVFLLYWKHLPESPRWLLLQGRYEEAQTIIEKAATVNGSVGGEFKLKLEPQETVVKPSRLNEFKLLLSSWYLLRSTLIIWASWMCLSGAYYGLSLNAKHMSGNIYLNYLYMSIVEMPAILILIPLMKIMPRRILLSGLMVLGGCACLLVLILPETWSNRISFVGKFFISGAYSFSYLISLELFPTSIRNFGLGVSSVMARIGGILCPFVLITKDVWKPMPLVIFGGSTLLVGFLVLLLRETESDLLETANDAKNQKTEDHKLLDNVE